jgi:hypothetical protein
MSHLPVIRTAIPKHRYQVGNYAATLLGEIDSGDAIDYRFIMAFVELGQSRPTFYVCAERNRPNERQQGAYRLRVVNAAMSEILDSSDRWSELEVFAEEAINLGKQALGLGNERVDRLL